MVALLRRYLAGSLLLLAVFTPVVESKCVEGGFCVANKGFVDGRGKTKDQIFSEVNCPGACYTFACVRGGGLQIGSGCEASIRKVCRLVDDEAIAKIKLFGVYFEQDKYWGCSNCNGSARDIFDLAQTGNFHDAFQGAAYFGTNFISDSCTYAAGSIHEVSLVLLGWIIAGWIFSARLW